MPDLDKVLLPDTNANERLLAVDDLDRDLLSDDLDRKLEANG